MEMLENKKFATQVPRAKVVVGITPKITLEQAQVALKKIAELNGCNNCGFSGIHLHFEHRLDFAHELRIENVLSAQLEPLAGGVLTEG